MASLSSSTGGRYLRAREANGGMSHPESRLRLLAFVKLMGTFSFLVSILAYVGPRIFDFSDVDYDSRCADLAWKIHAGIAVLSIVYSGFLRTVQTAQSTLLNLGTLYVVLTCFAMAFLEGPQEGLSFVTILVLLFPLFMPTSPQRAVLTAMAGASTYPLAMWAYLGTTGEPWPMEASLGIFLTYIVALFSLVPIQLVAWMRGELQRAQQLGSYELVEPIGSGGMGEVWRAKHRMLQRPAAVKLIRAERLAGDPQRTERAIERFEREAQASARLESPHTIQLYDFGVSDGGTLFHVMELLEGIDLERLVKEFGPIPSERVAYLLKQACDSLDEAHRKGLVHRDIKPGNLFLARRDRHVDVLTVLDFGLVKERRHRDVSLTDDGELAGTPSYLAPEMAVGESEVDGRADLYALGCVGYWLLTGELVFDGPTPMKIAVAHVTQTPEPPSTRLGEPIDPALESIIMSCLEKDPAKRPSNAAALERALAKVSGPAWTEARARAWWSRNLPELSEGLGHDVAVAAVDDPEIASQLG